ncbi:MAG: hypothetical protein ACRD1M_01980 [Terriglobales bacterium]
MLMLTIGVSAQRGSAARYDPRPASTVSRDMIQGLYQQAKVASTGVPDLVAPRLYAQVAGDEMRLFPQQAGADYQTAFAMARALSGSASDTGSALQAREDAKQAIELEAVSGLARAGDSTQALALTRSADVPKGPLYDELVLMAGAGGRGRFWRPAGGAIGGSDGGRAGDGSEKGSPMDEVFALVSECEHAGGGFPFRGVAAVLRRRDADVLGRMALVGEGYRAALDTAADQGAEVAMFLQAGHRAEPALDGELEATLVSLLGRAASQSGATGAGTATSASRRWLTLLRQIDPPQAEALAQRDPALSLPPSSPAAQLSTAYGMASLNGGGNFPGQPYALLFGVRGGKGRGFGATLNGAASTAFQFSANVAAPAPETNGAGDEAGGAQFRPLLAQAERLVRRQPAEALGLANQAADLLDDATLASNLEGAARLAQLYSELGDSTDAGLLLGRCLDQADREARAFDANYQSATPAQQALLAIHLDSAEAPVLAVYSLAARLDFTTAAERAEAAQFTLLKPAVLARVAVVGEVGQRPPLPRR